MKAHAQQLVTVAQLLKTTMATSLLISNTIGADCWAFADTTSGDQSPIITNNNSDVTINYYNDTPDELISLLKFRFEVMVHDLMKLDEEGALDKSNASYYSIEKLAALHERHISALQKGEFILAHETLKELLYYLNEINESLALDRAGITIVYFDGPPSIRSLIRRDEKKCAGKDRFLRRLFVDCTIYFASHTRNATEAFMALLIEIDSLESHFKLKD